ncbi:MAG: biotin/lipoyl-binding protein, partial [Acidobacteriota bacterium]
MTRAGAVTTTAPRLSDGVRIRPEADWQEGGVVQDRRTRRFYRFGPIELFILRQLDGRSRVAEIQHRLSDELGEALTGEEIHGFLDALRDKGLIRDTVPRLPSNAPDVGVEMMARLEAGGFRVRHRARRPPLRPLPDRRRDVPATSAFEESIAQLESGRFPAALRSLERVLLLQPDNGRARALYELLHQIAPPSSSETDPAPRTSRRSPLYLRWPLFDPDRWLARIEPMVRLVWTRSFACIYIGLLAAAAWVAARHADTLKAALAAQAPSSCAATIVVAAIALTIGHELSHALACKRYGGRVPEAGLLLIVFVVPAAYVDVSEAWLFDRRRRVMVSLAGPLFDLGAAAAGLVCWRVLAAGPLQLATLSVVLARAASFVLNMNPLLRLDGYYALSDLARTPNLRRAAWAAVRNALSRLLRLGRTGDGPLADRGRRPRAMLAVYGALSLAYLAAILGGLAWLALGRSAALAGVWGPVAALLVAGLLARRPLLVLARRVGRWIGRPTPRRAAGLALSLAALAALAMVPWPLKVSGPARLASAAVVGVRPEQPGIVAAVLVRDGDEVREGQVVARLDAKDLRGQLEMTRARVEQAEAQLALLARGPLVEEIELAREAVRAARAELDHARSRFERIARLRA